MTAAVIDLKDAREIGPIAVGATGDRLYVSFALVIPMFLYVQTVRGPVCRALGERLGNYLAGRDPTSGPSTSAPSDYARAAYERGNYATALWLFRTRAEQGDPDAQNKLGNMYRNGEGVAQVRHLDHPWGLRWVRVKGGKTRDIPLPSAVMEYLHEYVQRVLGTEREPIGPETPLFWSTWGRRIVGKTRAPMTGKNIWRLCKVYGRLIGCPTLKPHDLRHGVAMEVLEQHHDLEEVRALLGHARIDTTQVYASIRPPQLKRAVAFYEQKAGELLAE